MKAKAFSEWPDGWGIPFVIWSSGGTFFSKVRLNKHLAILQREGFPVMNRFVNHRLGPYDENIDNQSNKLCNYDLIKIKKEPSGREQDRTVYKTTSHGREFVEASILPLLDRLPFQEEFQKTFFDTARQFRYQRTEMIVKNVHKDLLLDDSVEFVNQLENTKDQLEHRFQRFQEAFVDFCPACLDVLGSLEFAIDSLNNVLKYWRNEGTTGKNHVFFNARVLSGLVSHFEGHEHFQLSTPEKRMKDENFKALNRIAHRLHCIEFNSDLYGILKPIDSEDYDFAEFLSPSVHSG
jgi:uncharacterized protein YwgA